VEATIDTVVRISDPASCVFSFCNGLENSLRGFAVNSTSAPACTMLELVAADEA